jgi:hypothetical protein
MAKLRNILALTVIFQLVFFSLGSAQPLTNVRYVAPGAACSGLLPCYGSIQAAMDDAASGDLIEIATGVYTYVTTRSGVPQIAFITKTLTLRGGYNADFSVLDPQAYPTILNAQIQGRVLYIDGTNISGSIAVTLDGLQLTGGVWSNSEYVAYNDVPAGGIDNSWWAAAAGGGVRVQNANITMLNSRLYNNYTFNGLGSGLFRFPSLREGSGVGKCSLDAIALGGGGNVGLMLCIYCIINSWSHSSKFLQLQIELKSHWRLFTAWQNRLQFYFNLKRSSYLALMLMASPARIATSICWWSWIHS